MAQTCFDVHPGPAQIDNPVAADQYEWQQLQKRLHEAVATAQHSSALLELLEKLESSQDCHEASYMLVNQLCDYLQCSRVTIGLRRNGKGPCRLVALSGLAKFDRRSDISLAIESTFDEAILRDSMTVWPERRESDHASTLAIKRLCLLHDSQSAVCLPLKESDGNAIGALLFLDDKGIDDSPESIHLIRALEGSVASRLSLLQRLEAGPVSRISRALNRNGQNRKAMGAFIAICVCFASLAIPIPYKIKCDCRLEPVTRRFVAAPFDGTLEASTVRPGDVVTAGQLLAHMDGREIRWDRAGLVADRNQAAKQRDSSMAVHNYAEAQIARLEMERLDLKIRVLDHRADNLEIKSPMAGIVTSGDLERAQGAPLTIGQTLFEIAPLDELIVEVAIPQDDIAHVKEDQNVIVRLDAYPGECHELSLSKVQPRSEIRDNQNVFIGEAKIDNSDGMFRPGMNGRAKVVTPNRSIGWILFHKAWESMMAWIGW